MSLIVVNRSVVVAIFVVICGVVGVNVVHISSVVKPLSTI